MVARRYIESAAFPRVFLRMDGSGVTHTASGSGTVNCQCGTPGPWEIFDLIDVPDGTINIGSVAFPGVYLRMDGTGVTTYQPSTGGGTVNCQYGPGAYEKFRLVPIGDGSFAIQSVQFDRVYLRLDGSGLSGNVNGGGGTVNAQCGYGPYERFFLRDPNAQPAGLTAQDLWTAIGTFAPIVRFHPAEKYMMCSVDWYLARAKLHDSATNTDINHPTADQLPVGASAPKRYWLIVEDGAKPGDLNTARAYVHAYWRPGLSYTDLQFWLFYAYNGPGTAYIKRLSFDTTQDTRDIDLSPLGEHWGDWECCTIRIDNASKQMIGARLSQHSGDQFFSLAQLNGFKRSNQQIIVYASRNGHALYPGVDTNYSEHIKQPDGPGAVLSPAGVEFYLRNDTGDGQIFNCAQSYEIVSADWLPAQFPEKRWVNYLYRWGPEGTSTNLRPDTAIQILKAALGPWEGILAVLSAGGTSFAEAFAALVLPSYVKDDLNGAGAPKTKDTWNS